jgi:hypothetical protein
MIEFAETTLEGSFGDRQIAVRTVVGASSTVVINIHGAYGEGFSQKYNALAGHCARAGTTCVFYRSSRLPGLSAHPTFDERRNQFLGKTFEDEVSDLRRVIEWTLTSAGAASEDFNIILNGNSLGGMLAFTVGTGLWLRAPDGGLLQSIPAPTILKDTIAEFRGGFIMHRGLLDDVFEKVAFDELFHTAVSCSWKRRYDYEGVDHPFNTLSGAESMAPYELVASRLVENFLPVR